MNHWPDSITLLHLTAKDAGKCHAAVILGSTRGFQPPFTVQNPPHRAASGISSEIKGIEIKTKAAFLQLYLIVNSGLNFIQPSQQSYEKTSHALLAFEMGLSVEQELAGGLGHKTNK